MNEIYFTMIVYVDDEERLKECIRGILGTEPENVKVVVVDSICSMQSMELCQKWQEQYGTRNFVYIRAYGMSMAEGYNTAIPEIEGRYVNFSLAGMRFSRGAMRAVHETAEESGRPKLISLSPWTVNEKGEYLQYEMSPSVSGSGGYQEISLNREPEKLNLFFHSYFIRCYLIKSRERTMWFRPQLRDDAAMEMLLNLLAEFRNYVYLPRVKVNYSEQLEDNTSAFVNQHYEWWYSESLKSWMIPFAEKWEAHDYPLRVPMRIALLYLVFARFRCNYNDRDKKVLQGEKLEEFRKLTGKLLRYIDNELIWKKPPERTFAIPRTMRVLFLKLKAEQADCTSDFVVHGDRLLLWNHRRDSSEGMETKKEIGRSETTFTITRDGNAIPVLKWAYGDTALTTVCMVENEHVILNVIHYKNGNLEIDGTFSIGDFLPHDKICLKAIKDSEEFPVRFSEVYGHNKVFGVTYNRKYHFEVTIPVFTIRESFKVIFAADINGRQIQVEIRSGSVYAHVRHDISGQYWRFSDDWCLEVKDKKELVISRIDDERAGEMEMRFRTALESRKKTEEAVISALRIRRNYFERKALFRGRRIWITFDKLYKAGDNGEYTYDYIAAQKDGIEIYYLIKRESPDYERMKSKGAKLLVWGEEETLITALYAEAILTTHANVISYLGFEKAQMPYLCDLFHPVNICIQHGLTVQNIAQFQNRIFDDLQLYLCASPNEIANLSRPIYGFTDRSALKLTGLARYDGLRNKDKHQILITPTWRRSIANSNVAHMKKGHNEFFKQSEYYRIYNRLINDSRLIQCAKKTGYRIIYLLHPAASAQIEDFDKNEYVELIPAASDMNYEKILTESSLMVTDYSGVQFDFAYMRKPVLYYHPRELPPHYEESQAYVYETMAFGPLIDRHEELVDTLCRYMKNHCVMRPEYAERADKFFNFRDNDNCERIYKAVLEFMDGQKELE